MFTGIIETTGEVLDIQEEGTNRHFKVGSPISNELKVDQSLSHDGVCLTVVEIGDGWHVVTAIEETLKRSKLGHWQVGEPVNLERSMAANGRLDGHIVQGHVDATAICREVDEREGSWYFRFSYQPSPENLLVDKGSVCVNGVSLTVVEPHEDLFSVAIIPYTWEHTNFRDIRPGDVVNLEFDIIGKYIGRYFEIYARQLSKS